MPRPGPRPYECVKRAWHSERHKPIRGSLIQEIFRVVNEIHSPATKKNKEWQDKLPIVVLKAEEIMYSKANSEAEYMDLKTLWDRANEAINTIIRLDESAETGVLLQPCIEAALILGCTPRRAMRSQRNSAPSYYLNVTSTEPTSCPPSSNPPKGILEAHTTISPFISDYSKIATLGNMNSSHLGFKSQSGSQRKSDGRPVVLETNRMDSESFLLPENECPRGESNNAYSSIMTPSVFPLYYGHECLSGNLKIGVEVPFESRCCGEGSAEMLLIQNISSCCANARKECTKVDIRSMCESSPGIGCDLSLRLGPCRNTPSSIKNRVFQEAEDFGSLQSRGSKMIDLEPQFENFVSPSRSDTADNSINSASSNRRSLSEILNVEVKGNKRKAVANHLYEDRRSTLGSNFPLNHHACRMRSAGTNNSELQRESTPSKLDT